MNCPTCGAQNLPNAAFCSQCATNLMIPPHMMGGMHHQVPRTSGMAIAGFVLSFFCSLLGLIFSIIGYNECKRSQGSVSGEGLAIAGIIISIIGMLLGVVILAGGRH